MTDSDPAISSPVPDDAPSLPVTPAPASRPVAAADREDGRGLLLLVVRLLFLVLLVSVSMLTIAGRADAPAEFQWQTLLGVLLAARTLQDRRVTDVIGVPALAVRQFWKVLRMLVFIGLVAMVLPPYGDGDAVRIEQNIDPVLWLMLLPLSLLALLLQTSAEEILFRGYLQQSLAARFRHPLIWIGIPSILFAFGHYLPAEAGENAGIIMVWAALFGVLMADLTARAGTLGPAIAVHLANNFTAILIVSAPGSLNGLSLLVLPFGLSDTEHMRAWLAVDFASMIVAWLGARLAIRA